MKGPTLAAAAFLIAAVALRRRPVAIGAMQSFRRVQAYPPSGGTNLAWTRGRSGVYVIYEDRRRVYIGHSTTDLYRTITRHFQAWDDPTQRRVTYADSLGRHRYDVAVTFTTPKQAASLERSLILKHRPRDNDQKYPDHEPDRYDMNTLDQYQGHAAEPRTAPQDDFAFDLPAF